MKLTTQGRRLLWQEDDAMPPDAEGLDAAYLRLFGVPLRGEKILRTQDDGDSFSKLTPRAMVCAAFDGGSIYELTAEERGPDGPQVHELKTWPVFFRAVLVGAKPFEVRKADRRFRVGDLLWLREWDPTRKAYTGRSLDVGVTYVLPDSAVTGGVQGGFCVLGLGPVSQFHIRPAVCGTCGARMRDPGVLCQDCAAGKPAA